MNDILRQIEASIAAKEEGSRDAELEAILELVYKQVDPMTPAQRKQFLKGLEERDIERQLTVNPVEAGSALVAVMSRGSDALVPVSSNSTVQPLSREAQKLLDHVQANPGNASLLLDFLERLQRIPSTELRTRSDGANDVLEGILKVVHVERRGLVPAGQLTLEARVRDLEAEVLRIATELATVTTERDDAVTDLATAKAEIAALKAAAPANNGLTELFNRLGRAVHGGTWTTDQVVDYIQSYVLLHDEIVKITGVDATNEKELITAIKKMKADLSRNTGGHLSRDDWDQLCKAVEAISLLTLSKKKDGAVQAVIDAAKKDGHDISSNTG